MTSGLLEIKKTLSARTKYLKDACSSSTFCLEMSKMDKPQLECRHDFYSQIQCQLYCADKNWCDFVLRTDEELHVEWIHRDRKWWSIQLAKLRKFYFSALIPELKSKAVIRSTFKLGCHSTPQAQSVVSPTTTSIKWQNHLWAYIMIFMFHSRWVRATLYQNFRAHTSTHVINS